MELDVYTKSGASAGRTVNASDALFGAKVNEHAIYMAVQAQRTNSRQGTRKTKTRSLVSGGGKKPWRQKGRGTARAGTTRSPIWRGGGTVFGPHPVDYRYRLPKKMKRLARISALSSKAKDEQLKILEDFTIEDAKTRNMAQVVKDFGLSDVKTLVLIPEYDPNILRASRNIKNLNVAMASDVSTYELLNSNHVLIMEGALEKLEGMLLS